MVNLQVTGDEPLLRAFKKFTDPTARRDLLDQIGAYGVSSTQQRFIDEKGPEGQPWKKSRRALERGGKTLRDRGMLFSSLTHNAMSERVEWGTNKVYGGIHQFGGTIRPKNGKHLTFKTATGFISVSKVDMPARPFLGIDGGDATEINAIAQDWMKGMIQ